MMTPALLTLSLLSLLVPVRAPVTRPDLSGHWLLDPDLTRDRHIKAGLPPAGGDSATPLGKHLVISQDENSLTMKWSIGKHPILMVLRFDGKETRDVVVGRDAPIEERSTARWRGDTLVVRTVRRLATTHEALAAFVRVWSIEGDILVVTTNGKIDSCFRRDRSPEQQTTPRGVAATGAVEVRLQLAANTPAR